MKEGGDVPLKRHLAAIVLGLGVGDSLGATSEFQIPWHVGKVCVDKYPGWPGKIVGGGKARWKAGEPTDDSTMALDLLRSLVSKKGQLDEDDIGLRFLKWKRTGPNDIGTTCARSLQKFGSLRTPFYCGGLHLYRRNPKGAANGSLMRNGPVAAVFYKQSEENVALDATIGQAIITHFGPLPTLTCIVQTLLIRHAINCHHFTKTPLRSPTLNDIKHLILDEDGPWQQYKKNTKYEAAREWLQEIGASSLKDAEKQLITELAGFDDDSYDPFNQDYRGRSGYCVLTLQISLWGLHWSFKDSATPSKPEWLPDWPFEKHKFDAIMWIVLIGADADTYGASAGPLLAAYHPHINPVYLSNLKIKDEVISLFDKLHS